jgi:hypothetical protein
MMRLVQADFFLDTHPDPGVRRFLSPRKFKTILDREDGKNCRK